MYSPHGSIGPSLSCGGSPQAASSSSSLCLARSTSLPNGFFHSGAHDLSEEQPSIFALREARRKTDFDAQTLANRIALLRQEGEKACKRLDETKLRAYELELRPNKASEQEALLKSRLQDIHTKQWRNRQQRETGRALKLDVQSALLESRKAAAKHVKETSKALQETQKVTEQSMRSLVVDRVALLKDRITGEGKQRMIEVTRLAQFAKNREERVAKGSVEVVMRQNTEKRISEMEREEEELMEWLQAKQLEQPDAYDLLADIAEARRARSSHAS